MEVTSTVDAHHNSANLDFLRSVAVLLVVISHLMPALGSPGWGGYSWGGLGMLGVALFFVHTCLVLMLSLYRQRERFGASNLAGTFFLRRFFRIYPLSIVCVCLSFGLARVGLAPDVPFSVAGLLSNLTLTQNLTGDESAPAVLWSLPFEVQMYLILPALFMLVAPSLRRGTVIVSVLWVLSTVGVLGIWFTHGNYQLIKFVPCFLPGVLAFTLLTRPRRLPFWVLPASLLLASLVFPVLVRRGVPETFLSWLTCLPLGVLLPHLKELTNATLARGAGVVAKYSYGIYLTHLWAIWFGMSRLASLPVAAQLVMFGASAALLAWLSYRLVEDPGIGLGRTLVERWMTLAQRSPG
jgi:peptidoglycan/LPS O-acetylase OafA/YrhL